MTFDNDPDIVQILDLSPGLTSKSGTKNREFGDDVLSLEIVTGSKRFLTHLENLTAPSLLAGQPGS